MCVVIASAAPLRSRGAARAPRARARHNEATRDGTAGSRLARSIPARMRRPHRLAQVVAATGMRADPHPAALAPRIADSRAITAAMVFSPWSISPLRPTFGPTRDERTIRGDTYVLCDAYSVDIMP